ncbi:MAG TPA: hypothetical protein VHC47_02925 [Mucilaginibacter sp.]|nr:hypothetical protein [Mucilaginibacter sp.]
MKRPYLILIPAIFLCYSCHHDTVQLVDGPKFSLNKGKKDDIDFSKPGTGGISGSNDASKVTPLGGPMAFGSASAAFRKHEPEPPVTEDLPKSYKDRKFLNNASDLAYDLFMIPGNIVKYNPKDTTYEFKTLRAIIKGNKLPVATAINDGMLYSAKINSNTSFNGSYLIGGLSVNKDEIMELNIQDAAKSSVPDSLIDVDAIKRIAESLPEDQRKNYFYIKSVTLTLIDNRKYSEGKFDASINSCFVTSGGKTYTSNEKFEREKTISVFLVSLDNLITMPGQ